MKRTITLTNGEGFGIQINLDSTREIQIKEGLEVNTWIVLRNINFCNKTDIFVTKKGALFIPTKEGSIFRYIPIEIWNLDEKKAEKDENLGIKLKLVNSLYVNDREIMNAFENAKINC